VRSQQTGPGVTAGQAARHSLPPFSHIDAVSRGELQPRTVGSTDHALVPTASFRTLTLQEAGRPGSPDVSVPLHRIAGAGRKKYSCDECGKTFDRPSSLRNHVNSHTGDQPFLCPFPGCGRRFSIRSNMLRHYRLHPGVDDSVDIPDGAPVASPRQIQPSYTFVLDPRGGSVQYGDTSQMAGPSSTRSPHPPGPYPHPHAASSSQARFAGGGSSSQPSPR